MFISSLSYSQKIGGMEWKFDLFLIEEKVFVFFFFPLSFTLDEVTFKRIK